MSNKKSIDKEVNLKKILQKHNDNLCCHFLEVVSKWSLPIHTCRHKFTYNVLLFLGNRKYINFIIYNTGKITGKYTI